VEEVEVIDGSEDRSSAENGTRTCGGRVLRIEIVSLGIGPQSARESVDEFEPGIRYTIRPTHPVVDAVGIAPDHLEDTMRATYKLIFAVTVAWLSLVPTWGKNDAYAAPPFSNLLVFGDSLSDTGNIFAASGGTFVPPPYYEGRVSNGPIWTERLAQELGLPNPLPSFVFTLEEGGTNFAWYGAETGPGFSDSMTPNLGMQIDMFLGGGMLTGEELILVRGGSNDLFAAALSGDDLTTSASTAAANIADHVGTLALAGGKVFLVSNLGGTGQTPFLQQLGPPFPALADWWEFVFNTTLDAALDVLEADLAASGLDVQIVRFDSQGLLAEILQKPQKFGLKNVTEAACPDCLFGVPSPGAEASVVKNPRKYLFWDLVHPTSTTHKAFGHAAAKQIKQQVRRPK
jgi:phospholipase/lecithinase/hemolysin